MSSPTVSLQNSGLAAQTASAVAVVSVPDAPPEMMELPAGSVLPAVLIPAETPAELPVMQLTLPDGNQLETQIKTNHPLRVPTPVSIKILPFDAKKTMSVRVHFSAPLPDVKKAVRDLPEALKSQDVVSAAVHKRAIPVRAFVLHSVPEQITALMNEMESPAEQDLPVLKPNQAVRLELSPQRETAPIQTEQQTVLAPPQAESSAVSAPQSAETLQPAFSSTAPVLTEAPQTPDAAVQESISSPVLQQASQPLQAAETVELTASPFSPAPERIQTPSPVQTNGVPADVREQTTPAVQTETKPPVTPLPDASPARESPPPHPDRLPAEQANAPLPQTEKTENVPERIPLKGVVFDLKERSAPLVVTKAGVLALEEKIQFPHLTPVSVKITEIAEPDSFIPTIRSEAPAFQGIEETLTLLQKSAPETFEAFKDILPQAGNKLPAQIAAFINAVSQNAPVSSFIGEANVAAIQNLGEKGHSLLKSLEKDFAASPKKASDGRSAWKGWSVPFLSGAIVEPVSLYLQKPQEDGHQRKGAAAKPDAVRFVLDLNLSRLGKLQMDGLAHRNERRFDLIVRHQNDLPASFDEKIRFIFTQTLTALNYTGTVKVDHTDQFIVLNEQIEVEKKRGVWA